MIFERLSNAGRSMVKSSMFVFTFMNRDLMAETFEGLLPEEDFTKAGSLSQISQASYTPLMQSNRFKSLVTGVSRV